MTPEMRLQIFDRARALGAFDNTDSVEDVIERADKIARWVQGPALKTPAFTFTGTDVADAVDLTDFPDNPDDPWQSDKYCGCGHLVSLHAGTPKQCHAGVGKGKCSCTKVVTAP